MFIMSTVDNFSLVYMSGRLVLLHRLHDMFNLHLDPHTPLLKALFKMPYLNL